MADWLANCCRRIIHEIVYPFLSQFPFKYYFFKDEEMPSVDPVQRTPTSPLTTSPAPDASSGVRSPDATLEPESEDELFINETPDLDDDDSFQAEQT